MSAPSTASPLAAVPAATPLWPLPLAAGLLPAVAVLAALLLYAQAQGVFCNAFVDDCVSISRMAKQGLANHLFRALVLPGAVLQALTWLVAADRFGAAGVARWRVRLLLGCGLVAALTLIVYGSFLGSEGEIYRWLRRRGPLLYFGGTYLAMVLFVRCARSLPVGHELALATRHVRTMVALLLFVLGVSVSHALASVSAWPGLEDRVENLSEWWGALALTIGFVVVAAAWRRWGLALSVLNGCQHRRRGERPQSRSMPAN